MPVLLFVIVFVVTTVGNKGMNFERSAYSRKIRVSYSGIFSRSRF